MSRMKASFFCVWLPRGFAPAFPARAYLSKPPEFLRQGIRLLAVCF